MGTNQTVKGAMKEIGNDISKNRSQTFVVFMVLVAIFLTCYVTYKLDMRGIKYTTITMEKYEELHIVPLTNAESRHMLASNIDKINNIAFMGDFYERLMIIGAIQTEIDTNHQESRYINSTSLMVDIAIEHEINPVGFASVLLESEEDNTITTEMQIMNMAYSIKEDYIKNQVMMLVQSQGKFIPVTDNFQSISHRTIPTSTFDTLSTDVLYTYNRIANNLIGGGIN